MHDHAYCEQCPYAYADCDEMSRDALTYIQQLEAAYPKWISVKERLPENGQWVLTYCGGYANWFELNKWCGDSWLKIMPVTHWMHMPRTAEGG